MLTNDKSREQLLIELQELKNEYEYLKIKYIKDTELLQNKETALLESQENFSKLSNLLRLMSDTMPDMMWAKDIYKKYIFVNKSFCKNLLNVSDTSEPIGKTQKYFAEREKDFFPDNPNWYTFDELCDESDNLVLNEKKEMQFYESGYISGKFIFLDVRKAPFYNSNGELVGLVGSARDITEVKETEESLKSTVSILKASLESTADGLLIVNSSGKITNWNKKFVEMWGLTDELLSNNDDDVINQIISLLSKPLQFIEKVNYLYSNPKETSFDLIEFLDGQIFERYSQAQIIGNKIVGRVWSFRDITESKMAEESISKLAMEQKVTLDTVTAGISHIKNRKVVWANAAHDRMFGYKFGETIGCDTSMFYTNAESYNQIGNEAYLKLENGKFYNSEIEMRKKDGTKFWCSLTGKLINIAMQSEGSIWMIQDISERKESELLLKQTRQNYEIFFNTIDDLLFVIDSNGFIINTNKTSEIRLGYSREELIGQPILMIHPPERSEESVKIIKDMLEGKVELCLIPVITKSGVQIPVETRVSYGIWNGNPAIFGVIKDMTNIKFSEEKFSKIFYMNPSACELSDLITGNYIEVNDAFSALVGYDKNEIIGYKSIELGILTPQKLQLIIDNFDSNGNIRNFETDLNSKNGAIKYVLLSSEIIYVQDKKYRFTILNDITVRKQIEEDLKETLMKLQTLVENVQQGILFENSNGSVQFSNHKFCELFGISSPKVIQNIKSNELIEKSKSYFQNPEEYFHIIERRVQDRLVVLSEELKLADGRTFERDFIPVELNKISFGYYWIFRDITERKTAEDELVELFDKLQISNKAIEANLYQKSVLVEELSKSEAKLKGIIAIKDKFFSIVSHDIRGPFSGFLGLTDLLAKEVDQLSLDEIKRLTGAINKSAGSVYMLIEDLLIWSGSQTGSIPFVPEVIDLYEISTNIIYSLKHTAFLKNIDLINYIEPVTQLTGDRNMIKTIFRNLITNAIKFTEEGGKIEIGTTIKYSESFKPPQSYYEVYIKDNGVGIPEENLDKLFKIEEHYTTPGTKKEKGTGLGLVLCKEFIQRHDGSIWVDSIENKGTTFYFTLMN